ncbi:MAG: AAA family ATPase [Magnetococcales bacterium]|nr:AAA family ATPase [Magnetococcales bacterium]
MRLLTVLLLCWLALPASPLVAADASPGDTHPLPSAQSTLPAAFAHDTLEQPDFPVLATTVSPDGQQMATAGYQIVHLWDRTTGHLRHSWRASDSWIRTLAFSPRSHVLAVAGDSGDVQLWDWEKRTRLHRLQGKGGPLYSIVFNPRGDLLAAGGTDQEIRLWNVAKGQLLKQWSAHEATIRGMAYNPEGTVLASGAEDGTLNRWHLAETIPVAHPVKGVAHGIYSVAYSPDGRLIAAGTFRSIRLWDANTGQSRPPLKRHTSWVRSLAFSPDSAYLASAADDTVLYLWDLTRGTSLEQWVGHQGAIFSVSYMRDQAWLSAGLDGRILIWQQGTPTPVQRLIGYPDGRWLSCHMVGQPHCEPSKQQTQPPTSAPPPAAESSVPSSISWVNGQRIGLILASLVTLLVFFGKRSVRPRIRAWYASWIALRQQWRENQAATTLPSPAQFARRLGGVLDFSAPNNRHMARICLPTEFPLAITDFFYLRVQPRQSLEKVPLFADYFVQHADPLTPTDTSIARPPLVLLVSTDLQQMEKLHRLAHHLDRLWVVPDRGEMTRLLLAAQPGQAFAQLLADHLDPALLSPYLVEGAVEKAGLFFGRQHLLELLAQQGQRNHLLIAGKGMGKSSLLQALARKYADHPILQCHLFAPEEHDIARPLARALGHAPATDLEHLLDDLARFPDRKKPILLVDDADSFVLTDAERRWNLLERLHLLSEAGSCQTILAGSWDLHRLLRNPRAARLTEWLNIHYVGPLEPEACWQLVRKPMAWINRDWDSGVSLDLIQSSGGRPDWAMALCHAVLEQLGPQDKIIGQHHLDAALISQSVGDRFDHWPALLSTDAAENWQDRMVVYSSVEMETFTHAELLALLQKKYAAFFSPRSQPAEPPPPEEQLQLALNRLELASLLQKAGDRYFYPSKLLRLRIMQQYPEDRLKRALRDQ